MHRNVRVALRALLVCYLAFLVGPMLPFALDRPPWPLFAGGAAIGALSGYVIGRADDPTRTLTPARTILAALVPLGYLLLVVPAVRESGLEGLLQPATAGVAAAIPAYLAFLLLVGVRSQTDAESHRHPPRDPDPNEELIAFEARLARRTRRRLVAVSIGLVCVFVGTGYALLRVADETFPGLGVLTASVASVVVLSTATRARREIVVTRRGLRVQGRLYDWDEFDGFHIDQDQLVVYNRHWWRIDPKLDVNDIENPRAVYRGLSQFLDRQ